MDAAHLGRRQEHVVGLFHRKKGFDHSLVGEVKLGVGAGDEGVEALGAQVAHEGGADQAAVARNIDFVAWVHLTNLKFL